MKARRYSGSDLRKILIGMVTDRTVCARVAAQWDQRGLFDAPWANLVGNWCVKHIRRYQEPPNGNLQTIYEDWASKASRDEATREGVERFLQALSDEYSKEAPPTSEYLLDLAGRYFNKVRLSHTIEAARDKLEDGDVDAALLDLTALTRVELGSGSLVDLNDYEVWRAAFDEDKSRPVIQFPGALGDFINPMLRREQLIALTGSDKSAKSFFLLEFAYLGLRQKRRVAYIEAGDLSQGDVIERLARRVLRWPEKPGTYDIPVGFDEEGELIVEARRYEDSVTPQAGYKAFQKLTGGKDLLRVGCYPNDTVTVEMIRGQLGDWEREGWVPDAVIIDYADILAPPRGVRDTLEQIDKNWKQLRRLSQECHSLVVTASQASAEAYRGKESGKPSVLRRRHFSGRKTKLAHVGGMLGLVMVGEGEWLVNWQVRRKGAHSEGAYVRVYGNLDVGRPVILSRR